MRFPEFSGEWELKSIEHIAPLQRGFDLPKQNINPGCVPIVYSNGILGTHSEGKCIGPGVVTGRSGTIGKLTYVESGPYWPHNTSLWVTNFYGNHEKFVYYLYQHIGIEQYASGSGVPTLNRNDVHRHIAAVPCIDEQRKIASMLSLIDELIAVQSKIIEEQETLLRSLRHKIYSRVQAQSQCTIADVLCYEQPTKYLVTDTDYTDDDSQVPVLTANKAFILGYTTENFGIYDKGPCIILDDFTLDCKYVDFKFKVKSSAIKILRAKAKTNLRFIFEYFRFLELNTTEHRRHYIAEIEPMSILLPSNEEIDRIARLFTALDERLEAARKELKILESQKMYMLQKMFI